MTHFVKLSSEKYLAESQKQEARDEARRQRQQAHRTMRNLLGAAFVFAATLVVALNISDWMDSINGWF